MNILKGTISHVDSSRHTSLVEIDVNGDLFSVVLLETAHTNSCLKENGKVSLMFKETEVFFNRNKEDTSSILNQFWSKVASIQKGVVLSEISFEYQKNLLRAIIPTKSLNKIKLKIGEEIVWCIKVNEITLRWE
ncbi:MAG: hypothetical protein KC733_02385 [Candidatus Omnitrophica bacterium]|nr:hypothetical protein [Candidatus Omnitrophota bacterium]